MRSESLQLRQPVNSSVACKEALGCKPGVERYQSQRKAAVSGISTRPELVGQIELAVPTNEGIGVVFESSAICSGQPLPQESPFRAVQDDVSQEKFSFGAATTRDGETFGSMT